MKKTAMVLALISMIIIIYFLIKEQFNHTTLSHTENIILSVTYLVIGISGIILVRAKALERKNK